MPLAFLPHQDVWEEDEPESDYPFGNLLKTARASSKECFRTQSAQQAEETPNCFNQLTKNL